MDHKQSNDDSAHARLLGVCLVREMYMDSARVRGVVVAVVVGGGGAAWGCCWAQLTAESSQGDLGKHRGRFGWITPRCKRTHGNTECQLLIQCDTCRSAERGWSCVGWETAVM
jgi:hypothetical protein